MKNLNKVIMRKLLILSFFTFSFVQLNAQISTNVQEGAGFFLPEPGEKFVVGNDKSTKLWKTYIDAHNNRDLESLLLMESDSILIVGPTGNRISGKAQHKEALSVWFDTEEPEWNIYWAMPYKGVLGGDEWIIAGHEVTTTVDGKEVKQNHMIDAKITKDGKVELFYVYKMDIPAKPRKIPMPKFRFAVKYEDSASEGRLIGFYDEALGIEKTIKIRGFNVQIGNRIFLCNGSKLSDSARRYLAGTYFEPLFLEDGETELFVKNIYAGSSVKVMDYLHGGCTNEYGESIPCDDEELILLAVGQYTLKDGRILVVEEEGVIAESDDFPKEPKNIPSPVTVVVFKNIGYIGLDQGEVTDPGVSITIN